MMKTLELLARGTAVAAIAISLSAHAQEPAPQGGDTQAAAPAAPAATSNKAEHAVATLRVQL